MVSVVNIAERLREVDQPWQPRIAGAVNDFHVKVVRLEGEFLWHHHETEDELFLVISGEMQFHHRDASGNERVEIVRPGEFVIVPHGTEHKPAAPDGAEVLLFEPATTLNTGTAVNERTWVDRK